MGEARLRVSSYFVMFALSYVEGVVMLALSYAEGVVMLALAYAEGVVQPRRVF